MKQGAITPQSIALGVAVVLVGAMILYGMYVDFSADNNWVGNPDSDIPEYTFIIEGNTVSVICYEPWKDSDAERNAPHSYKIISNGAPVWATYYPVNIGTYYHNG